MFELEDFIGEPFNFGECEEYVINANIKCDLFDEQQNTQIVIRKKGDWVNMHVAGVMKLPKVVDWEIGDRMTLTFDYPANWPEKSDGEENIRRWRYFSCLCRVYDENMKQGKFVPGLVEQRNTGEIDIFPANYSEIKPEGENTIQNTISHIFKVHPSHQIAIGFTTFDITFKLNDGHLFGGD